MEIFRLSTSNTLFIITRRVLHESERVISLPEFSGEHDDGSRVKPHNLRNKSNYEAQDMVETVDVGEFYMNDDVLSFMLLLVEERQKLTDAIGRAKASVGFDIDAAVETNKFRQAVAARTKAMLRFVPSKRIEQGRDYKFNVEGNQTPYLYEIEVETTEAFDRGRAKDVVREIMLQADKASAEIDSALINTQVEYEPPFNVNDSFDDVMEEFLAKRESPST